MINKMKYYGYRIIIFAVILFILFQFFIAVFSTWILNYNGETINAIIVDERANYANKGSLEKEIEYKYNFFVNGSNYFGNSECSKFKVGDSIQIRYWKLYPRKNHAVWILENRNCE
jgi:hypothetical protein